VPILNASFHDIRIHSSQNLLCHNQLSIFSYGISETLHS